MKIHPVAEHLTRSKLPLPFYLAAIPAGFPSPADDYMDKRLDLNEHLINNDAATFYCRVSGDSMQEAGIFSGDLLVVDRSITPKNGSVVLASLDGEFTCKILDVHRRQLISANHLYKPIKIQKDSKFTVEGVVIHSIRSHHDVRSR